MSVGAVLSSALSFVLKYGAIWFALRTARYLIVLLILDPCRSHLRHLPGPSANGYFSTEVMLDLQAPGYASELHEKYEKEHGKTIRIQGFGYYDPRLTTLDPLSINYILNRAADVFEKPWITQRFVSRLVGGGEDSNPGIFATEGEDHRKLRRLLAPAFSYQSVKRLAPLFLHKSFELRDKLRSVLATEQTASRPGVEVEQPANEPRPRVRLDLHYWIGRATFDIIGVAGFGHEFHSIQEKPNEFYNAYRYMFDACRTQTIVHTVALFFPSWIASRLPDSRSKQVRKSRSMIRTETERLLTNRRNAIAAEKAAGAAVDKDFSILNLLLRTNESSGATLTDVQILKQIESIMFTGHDTTSLAIEWGLWELTRYPSIQARLREELAPFTSILKDFSSETPSDSVNTYSDLTGELADLSARLDALPYLENFVREVLRLHPSVQSTLRVATKDDVIPVSEPVRAATGEPSKAWIGGSKTGLPAGGIRIRKGEYIHVPIEGFNSFKGVWGEDAFNFNPERWNNLSAAAKSHPGLYAGLMSFSVGPHSCPASRWAILEMKLMIAVLVSSFNFTAASKMNGFNFLVVKPYVDNQFERGHRMPLGLTPIE